MLIDYLIHATEMIFLFSFAISLIFVIFNFIRVLMNKKMFTKQIFLLLGLTGFSLGLYNYFLYLNLGNLFMILIAGIIGGISLIYLIFALEK